MTVPIKVLCDGDSWTKGQIASTPQYHTWRTRLQALIAATPGFPTLDWVGPQNLGDAPDPDNNGIDASTISQHAQPWLGPILATYTPDVVIMCLGINDAFNGPIDLAPFKQYWRDVNTLRPTAKRLWIIPPNVWGTAANGVNLDAFNAQIPGAAAQLAGEGINVLVHDWRGVITAPGDLINVNHPNSAGHDKLGDSLWPTFKTLIGFTMGTLSDYLAHKLLNHVLGGSDFTPPATIYLAAFVNGVEVTQFARKAVTNDSTNFPPASSRTKYLHVGQSFAAASADAGAIDEIRAYDASSGGNELFRDAITPVTINNGGTLSIAADALAIVCNAGPWSDYLSHKLLDLAFSGAAYSRPATVYLGGYSSDPQAAGTQITADRASSTNNATNWPAASGRAKSLATLASHAAAGSDIGTVSHLGVSDASSAGNLLLSSALSTPQPVLTGQALKYRPGEVTFSVV